MDSLHTQIAFFISIKYIITIKYNSLKNHTELWVDGYVYVYDLNGNFVYKASEEVYENKLK